MYFWMLSNLPLVMWHKPYKGRSIKSSIFIKANMISQEKSSRDQKPTVVMYCWYPALFLRHTVHIIDYMTWKDIPYSTTVDLIISFPFLRPLAWMGIQNAHSYGVSRYHIEIEEKMKFEVKSTLDRLQEQKLNKLLVWNK